MFCTECTEPLSGPWNYYIDKNKYYSKLGIQSNHKAYYLVNLNFFIKTVNNKKKTYKPKLIKINGKIIFFAVKLISNLSYNP